MPRISEFHGIAIYMYYNDHAPPHFHAIYRNREAVVGVESGDIMEGDLPKRSEKRVIKWAGLHRDELRQNWERARLGLPLNRIDPLE